MKLSQSILISLSILICFSPTLSLAMEEIYSDINCNRIAESLKKNNQSFFTSIYEKKNPDKIKNCLKKMNNYFLRTKRFFTNRENGSLSSLYVVLTFLACHFLILGYLIKIGWDTRDTNKIITNIILMPLAVIIAIFLSVIIAGLFYDSLAFEEFYSIKDSDFIKALETRDTWRVRNMLSDTHRFQDFDPDKYLTLAFINDMPTDILQTLYDKGGKFISENFGQVIAQGKIDKIKLLVALGINVNVKDVEGTPAVTCAVLSRTFGAVNLLLSKEADFAVVNAKGKTTLDYLNELMPLKKTQEIINKLQQYRQKIAEQIYNDLEQFNFPKDHAHLISEYLV